MAGDNIATALPGIVLATDEINQIHYPISKLAFGVEDDVTLVSQGDPLPVGGAVLASILSALQTLVSEDAGLATATGQASALTALQALATALPLPTGAATQATLAAILAKLIASPATEATLASCLTQLQTIAGSGSGSGSATAAGQASELTALTAIVAAVQGTLAISAAALPLPAGAATQTTAAAILAKLSADPATQTTLAAVLAKLSADPATQTTLAAVLAAFSAGQKASSASLSVVTSKDQDPIFDHANGTKTSVTASATIMAVPAGCGYLRISTDVDIYVNTAGNTAVDDGTSLRVVANTPEVIPVVAGTLVKALSSSGTATVRCTPLKSR